MKQNVNSIFKTYYWDIIVHHYADFKGAMTRKAYWMLILINWLMLFTVSCAVTCIDGTVGLFVYLLLGLSMCFPMLSAAVRRLHDIGKSGWMIFVSMIPLIGLIYLLVLLCRKGQSETIQPKWNLTDTIHIGALGLLVAIGTIISIVGGEKYYVYEDSEWMSNSDYSRFFAVATTDKRDLDNEFIERYGTQVIVSADEPHGDDMEVVISAKDIAAMDMTVGHDLNYEIFPSTVDPNLLYFNYWQNGMEFPLCGKVDCNTGEFELLEGTIIGMISDGKYDNCFARVDIGIPGEKDGLKIFRQRNFGESAKPVLCLPGDYHNFIFDKTSRQEAIEIIESW